MSDNRAVAIMPFGYNNETLYRVGVVNADWSINSIEDSHRFWLCMDEETTTPDYALAKLYADDLAEKEQVEHGVIENEVYRYILKGAIDDYCEAMIEPLDNDQPVGDFYD